MENLKYFFYLIGLITGGKTLGPLWGGLVATGLFIGIVLLVKHIKKQRQRRDLQDRFEDIHLVEMPGGRWIDLNFKPGIYILATRGNLRNVANYWSNLLKEVGNKRSIQIYIYRFQDGENVNESEEQYVERIEREIGVRRVQKHQAIKSEDPAFYLKVHHGDKYKEIAGNIHEWDT